MIVKALTGKGLRLSTLNSEIQYLTKNNIGGSAIYDVAGQYDWTVTPPTQRKNIPIVKLVEYEQDLATIYAQLAYFAENIKLIEANDSENVYKNLYHAKPTKTVYILPYLEQYHHSISQQWSKTNSSPPSEYLQNILKYGENILKLIQQAPGITGNQPQIWSSASNGEYSIMFPLFNTINESSIDKNNQFINRIIASTLHNQRSAILSSPPAIFEISIPGIRYSPAAVIQQCVIENVGQINRMDGFSGWDSSNDGSNRDKILDSRNIPDAYQVTLRIQELIVESRQIFHAAMSNKTQNVRAISEEDISDIALETAQSYNPLKQKPKN